MSNELTDEQIAETLAAVPAARRPDGTINSADVGKALGIHRENARRRLKRLSEKGLLGFKPVMDGFVVKKVSTQLDASGDVQKTFVQQAREPGKTFAVPQGHVVKGVSALLDADNRIVAQWIKTNKDAERQAELIDAIKATFDGYKGRAELARPPECVNSDLMTVYPIGDMHLGQYSHKPETGEDWDLRSGERALRDTMAELVSTAPNSETGVVLSLGDFFHADDSSNRTPQSGHALDVDTRRNKVLQVGVKLLIDCIELALQKHKHVVVRCLPGNHDPATTPALTIALWAFFHSEPRVEVDCSPSRFFYKQFGKVMVAATHGDQCKMQDMPGVMAATQPEMWGSSRWRVCYTGHIHHRSQVVKEVNGVVCESFQVLPPADAWHAGMGYGAGRSMMAITHHKDFGEKIRNVVSICPSF
jgi:DNA-binding Lrp family transcriptional regulator